MLKDLVLIGGGHSHAIVLKLLGMKPIEGVRITLITDTSHTPYSGMLPAHVAGLYSFDATHIDLRRLAQFSQAQLYLDQAIGLDLVNNKVVCANHPPVAFDFLSIDIGSTPARSLVTGAEKYAIPAKPVPQFLQAWEGLLAAVDLAKKISISIVGGGAGGVELALNMQGNLRQRLPADKLEINLFQRGRELLAGHNYWVGKRLREILVERGVKLHLGENVREVFPEQVVCESGLTVGCDYIFWVTQAAAPDWVKLSGLATDAQGFILVEDTLQSQSHPHVFAAGDIATMVNYSRPKAGVFAVRQGKPLGENITRIIQGKKLKKYVPQKRYLSLIGTGDKKAIASWGFWGWESPLCWRWKDYIDQKFMGGFRDLLPMNMTKTKIKARFNESQEMNFQAHPLSLFKKTMKQDKNTKMFCAGCGAKVGSGVLTRVLNRLEIKEHKDVLIGINNPDDAAVVQVTADKYMVQTVDYFPSLINDPFVFGQIATNHCLSDIYAMGATPQTALAIATIPYGKDEQIAEILYQLLSGAIKVLDTTPLVGGHTTEGTGLAFGLACNGLVNPEKLLQKSGMKPGDVLMMNKAIGIGTLFAAEMNLSAKGRWIDGAVESMLLSNEAASQIFLEHGATACTDITGFGLLGHLREMVSPGKVGVELDLEAIPILVGAMETIAAGFTSSLQPQNLQAAQYISNLEQVMNEAKYQLLFDPQTAGGLLASIPEAMAISCLNALQNSGYLQSSMIGRVVNHECICVNLSPKLGVAYNI
ncbi:MAG: selenide, water dikinase SelD [Gomphosphaeria aponina SAG 52.96 = DSM 107014]|uniref:Selenide, water dikinase SelD n=1 Tax=Gomphosphaeria aponina SAG 52.96 = DSM 107014 TaxID=1521640 RepID=A0A941GT92_9CHRO|nr:selenide, water dikinase SelD [Gomphosphaeria aponina SAG 52.96 = DSM 107014]